MSHKSSGSNNNDLDNVTSLPATQKHLLHSKLPLITTHSQISLSRGAMPTLQDSQAHLPQFAIQPEQMKEKYLLTPNKAAPIDMLPPQFGHQSISSKQWRQGNRQNSKIEIKDDNQGLQAKDFLHVEKLKTGYKQDEKRVVNVDILGQNNSPQPTGSYFESCPSQFPGSPTLGQNNRRESMNSILTPVALNPTMNPSASKNDTLQKAAFGALQAGQIQAANPEKKIIRTTVNDQNADSRNCQQLKVTQLSFDNTNTTKMGPVDHIQNTKGSFNRTFNRNDNDTLVKLQNPNIAQITKHGPGQIMVQYRQLQLQNYAKQELFNPGLVVGKKMEQSPRKEQGKLKQGLTKMTAKRPKATKRSPKNADIPNLMPIRMELSRSNSKEESFQIQPSIDHSSIAYTQQTETQSPPKRHDMKQVYLQSFPGGEELGSAVVGTRVILSHPHSRDEDIHTDAGSNLLDRKESPATNIKRLQRQSLAVVEIEENRMLAKETYTPTSPAYAGFTPQTPQRFEEKFGTDSNFGVGTELNVFEARKSQIHIESSQDPSPGPQANNQFGSKSNEFAQLDERDKALLNIGNSPKIDRTAQNVQFQTAGTAEPPQVILSQYKVQENGEDSFGVFQNSNKANHTFVNVMNQDQLDVQSTVKIVSSKKDLHNTNRNSEVAGMSMQAQAPAVISNNQTHISFQVENSALSGAPSTKRKQIILKASSNALNQTMPKAVMPQNQTEVISREQTEWKQLKTTDSGKIDFKPESSLSHHGNTAPKASIFEVSKASAQQTSSSVSSKAGTKGLLEKNKSLNLPLKKILGIEQKTGNVKIANSSRLSKSPNRHKFQAYSLIELDQKSQSDYKNSKGSISPGHTLSDEYGKDFFTGSKESLQKFKEFKKRKDHSGFIYKDTAWMQDKGDDGKIVCPSYSHVYTEKVPAKPIHGRIYTKVTQQLNKTRQKSNPKHTNTQAFTHINSEPPKFLSSKNQSALFQQSSLLNKDSQSSASNLSKTEQLIPTRGSRISSNGHNLNHQSSFQRNLGMASSELNSLLHQKQMIEHFMLANSSSPKIASFINFENSAKSLYGFNGIVAESQMMESRNHSLFDKKKSNLSPAPTDGVSADKKQTNQQKSFHDESGGTNQFKESGLTGFQGSTQNNLHEKDVSSSVFSGEKLHHRAAMENGPGGSFAVNPSQSKSQHDLSQSSSGRGAIAQSNHVSMQDLKEPKNDQKPVKKQGSIRKIEISTQQFTKIDDIIAFENGDNSSLIGTQTQNTHNLTSKSPFALQNAKRVSLKISGARVDGGDDSNGVMVKPLNEARQFVKEGGQDVDPSLYIKKIDTPGSDQAIKFHIDIKSPTQKSTERSNAEDQSRMGVVNSISYNAEAIKNMANQFKFKKNKRVFVGEKPYMSKQEMYGDKSQYLRQGLRDANRKSFVEQNQVLLGGHKDLQRRPNNQINPFESGKVGEMSHSRHASKPELGQKFHFQQSAYSIRGAELSVSGLSPRDGNQVPEIGQKGAKVLQNSTAHLMNFQPLSAAQKQRLLQQSQMLKQARSPHGTTTPYDVLEKKSKEGQEGTSASVHSSVLQQISEIGRQYIAHGQTPDQANRPSQSGSPAMRQLPQQSLQTATQPRRARKKKSRQKSTAQPLLNMSQVLNEINHSIKSPSKRQPDKPRNFLRQNPDLSNQAKKLIGRNLQKSSVYIPDASNGSLFALDTPYVLPNSLKSQVFSHSPVRENPRNVQFPDLIEKRKIMGRNYQNMLSPLPEKSQEAITSQTVQGLESEVSPFISGQRNQENIDLDQRIKQLHNKTFQKQGFVNYIEPSRNFQLITMSSEGTHGFRQEKTPENIHRMIAKKNKEEDETIKVLRAQLSQDNSKDLIAQSNQISKDILNQILTSNNSSKVNITFDDRGPLVQKKLPTSPLNQGVLSSNHNFQKNVTLAGTQSSVSNENDHQNSTQNGEVIYRTHWSYTNPAPKTVQISHDKDFLQNCKPILSVIPGSNDPNLKKDISKHKEFQSQNLSPGKNLAKIKQNIVETSLLGQAPQNNAQRSTLMNLDRHDELESGQATQIIEQGMFPEIKVNKVSFPDGVQTQRQSLQQSN